MTDLSRKALGAAIFHGWLTFLWWLASEYLLPFWIHDAARLQQWQQTSGYLWLVLSALVLFLLRRSLVRWLGGEELQRRHDTDHDRLRIASAVFDSTREGVLVTNDKGQIVHVNRAFVDITGYQPEEVLGRNPSTFKSGRHDAQFYTRMYESIGSEGQWSGEIWNRRKSGEVYPQWQNISGIQGSDGRVRHYVAVFSDLSAIKRSEQERMQMAHYEDRKSVV